MNEPIPHRNERDYETGMAQFSEEDISLGASISLDRIGLGKIRSGTNWSNTDQIVAEKTQSCMKKSNNSEQRQLREQLKPHEQLSD
ncbi:Vacuolar protein sorting-associated protein 13A [Dorcoceras hygrometricum]|uniref:Vacuolar protein sorting-associated protein 13A n=1 Tax=Dorcoceras hygrometricum TaxID=472368 RepID=A0A2Z7CWE3_9LAMI|nr:Vacuolar protein sorting-associated protein 13A [Dorcoceras hygrometricum]